MIKSNFLHNHPQKERELGLDRNHVIVDREDWEIAKRYVPKYTNQSRVVFAGIPTPITIFDSIESQNIFILENERMANEVWAHNDRYLMQLQSLKTKKQFDKEYLCNPIIQEQAENISMKILDESIKSLSKGIKVHEFKTKKQKKQKKQKGHERPYKFHL